MEYFPTSRTYPLHPSPAQAINGSGPLPEERGMLRFLNTSSAPFPLHILLDDRPFAAGSVFSSLTNYAPASPGLCRAVLLNGENPCVRLLETALFLEPGTYTSAVIADSSAQGLQIFPFLDHACQPDGSGCFLRAVNAAMEDKPLCLCRQDGTRLWEALPYSSASPYIRLPAGPMDFYVTDPQAQDPPSPPLASLSMSLRPSRSYTIYLAGSLWLPGGLCMIAAEDC